MFKRDFSGAPVIVIVAVGILAHAAMAAQEQGETEVTQKDATQSKVPALKELTIRVIQDNYRCRDDLETAWGFAAYVTGPKERILFDTGSDGEVLLRNMAKLEIAPQRVDTVVLSHVHADHTGGLVGFLKQHADVALYCPASFPARFKEVARGYGVRLVEVQQPRQIGANVFTTGQIGTRIQEQALVLRTEKGLVVLTGCAHPGVVKMIETVKANHEEDILLVMGGFHLGWATEAQIGRIIEALDRLGVRYVGPTHCSGDKTRELFQKHFGKRYINIGVGTTIDLADLT